MASGGYRPPANPAQVSGPGALSRRTDQRQPIMALPDPKYGEQTDFHDIQAGAPMSAPPGLAQGGPTAPVAAPPTPFGAPTTMPGQPVTSGAPMGPGAGPEALNLPQGDTRDSLKAQFGPILPTLIAEAQSKYATQAFKDSVAALIALF